ncbi:MAG: WG repeat-containing protein [Clostridia bacterium]|nr:WG repeat-containing protein [Clostridia bacterium]
MKKKQKLFILSICVVLILVVVFIMGMINKARRNYELEKVTDKNYFILYKAGKVGVINTLGDVVINPEYNYIQLPNPFKDVFVCMKGNKSVVLNSKAEEIFTNYEEVSGISVAGIIGDVPFEKTVLKYKKDNLYGLINMEGKEITKAIYEKIESVPYKEGEILVQKDGKQGVINAKGVELVGIKYNSIIGDGYYNSTDYKEAGYIVSIKNNENILYGYIDKEGREVLKTEFTELLRLTKLDSQDVYLLVSKDGKKGLYKNGKILLENKYDQIEYNDTLELLKVRENEYYGVKDLNGKTILASEYKDVSFNGIYILAENQTNQIVNYDKTGKEIPENNYKKVIATENEDYFITVGQNNLYGIINKNGAETTTNKYTYIDYLAGEYFAAYNEESLIGIINQFGNTVLPIQYNLAQKIPNTNMIQVTTTNGLLEIYTNDMKQVAAMKNAKLYTYPNYIRIISDTESKYIDKNGKVLSNKEAIPENTLFATAQYGLWGFEDKDGNLVVDRVYNMVTEFNKYGFAGIKKGDKWGIIKQDGTIIVDPTYEITDENELEFIGKYHKVNYGGSTYFTDEII